uniref:Uncharacterized protein n=1 Tax=Anguilla anguilla TaxID=7936 RepID=A0A0E9XXY6_ANGAN
MLLDESSVTLKRSSEETL